MPKTKLSVNVNKIATLRNARGKNTPDLLHLVKIIIQAGAQGITVHPRPDERHIRYQDVLNIKQLLKKHPSIEFNIEGYPNENFLKLIEQVKPHQCTLVPDPPEVLTSNAGWAFYENQTLLSQSLQKLKTWKIRSSLFCDAFCMNQKEWDALQNLKPDRIELYTEAYAENYNSSKAKGVLSQYQKVAQQSCSLGITINAGHDLNQNNLLNFLKSIPEVQEISVGQALISEALEAGLGSTIQSYLKIIEDANQGEV